MRKAILVGLILVALALSGCLRQQAGQADENAAPETGPKADGITQEPLGKFSLSTQPEYSQLLNEIEQGIFNEINEKRQRAYCQALELKRDIASESAPIVRENVYKLRLQDEYGKWANGNEIIEEIVKIAIGDDALKKNVLECGLEESSIEAVLNARDDAITVTQKFAGKYSTACFDEDATKCELSSSNYYAIVNEEFYCDPSHYVTSFGVELKNRGNTAVPMDSVVRVILENNDSTYDYLREAVEPNKKFWEGMKSIVRTPAFEGRTFTLNTGTYGQKLDLDYWIVYCYPGTRPSDCSRDEGRVIYTGNLLDCNAEKYLQPYSGIIIEVKQ